MKFLKKLKSSNFWVSMISAVVLILQAVFNVDIKTEYLNQIILGILGLLVMSGIVTDTSTDEVTVKQNLDFDSIKENITNIFTQITTNLQTDLSKVVTQLNSNVQENINNSSNIVSQNENVEEVKDISVQDEISNSNQEEISQHEENPQKLENVL